MRIDQISGFRACQWYQRPAFRRRLPRSQEEHTAASGNPYSKGLTTAHWPDRSGRDAAALRWRKGVEEAPVRFIWPAQRYDRLTREATIVAGLLTVCAAFAIVRPAIRIYRSAEGRGAPSTDERVETITFVQRRPAPATVSRTSSFVRSILAPAPAPLPPSAADTGSLITNRVESSARVETPAAAAASESKAAPRALGPYSASAGITLGRIDSGAAPPPPWTFIPATQEQRDSAGRAEAQRAATARDDHRPMPIVLGSIPLRMPFGGAVRSREQRARDSVVNLDYLQRLARLAERARAKRESTLAARVVARRDSGSPTTPKP